jgi:hypothetical protein
MILNVTGSAECGKCVYFDTENVSAHLGLCRYNPPIGQPTNDEHGIWPRVETADWCGRFEAKMSA